MGALRCHVSFTGRDAGLLYSFEIVCVCVCGQFSAELANLTSLPLSTAMTLIQLISCRI